MQLGDIIFMVLGSYILYDLLLSPTGLLKSRKEIMRHVRKQNERKGIIKRPGWNYGGRNIKR